MRNFVIILIIISVLALGARAIEAQAVVPMPQPYIPVAPVPGLPGGVGVDVPPDPFAGLQLDLRIPSTDDLVTWGIGQVIAPGNDIYNPFSARSHGELRHPQHYWEIKSWPTIYVYYCSHFAPRGIRRIYEVRQDPVTKKLGIVVKEIWGAEVTVFPTHDDYIMDMELFCSRQFPPHPVAIPIAPDQDDQ